VLAHAHSGWSHDSSLTLSFWVECARQLGVGAILLTEHEDAGWTPERYVDYVRACRMESTPDVALIPGIEFSQEGRHILCYGLDAFPARPSSLAALATSVRRQGRWLCLAHPAKYRWQYPEAFLDAVDAVEVWNSKWIYDGALGPHPRSLALARGKAWLAGQDVHKRRHLSRLFIETSSLDPLADIGAGRYEFSFGGRGIATKQLQARKIAGVVQRARTILLRKALTGYRFVRRLRRAGPIARGVSCLGSREPTPGFAPGSAEEKEAADRTGDR
jgi:hypothetical protein